MIGTPKKTFEILKKHGFTFKKSLGQNFLIDANILNRIVDGAGINDKVGVIEIGPGIGSLTEAVAKKAKRVISFEIDGRLLPILSETLADYSNVEIINNDILKVDVDKIIEEKMSDCEKIMVVANLPYYITTPILTHLIENTKRIDGYVVMMQREVANRLNAKVGTKDYNSLTILLNYYTNVEYLVKIMRKDKKEFEADSKFFKFVRSCFVQRRKTLLNNLISSYGKDKKQDLQNSCLDSEIDSTRRSETLSLREFYNLYNNLKNNDLI